MVKGKVAFRPNRGLLGMQFGGLVLKSGAGTAERQQISITFYIWKQYISIVTWRNFLEKIWCFEALFVPEYGVALCVP